MKLTVICAIITASVVYAAPAEADASLEHSGNVPQTANNVLAGTSPNCNGECAGGYSHMGYGHKHCPCPCPILDHCPILHPKQQPATVPPPDLTKANWIWTKEVIGKPNGVLPGAARPFRKGIKTKCPVNRVMIDITCDNYYTLYVNGKLVGSGDNWTIAQRYTVEFEQTTEVVIAVYAVQDPIYTQQVGLLSAGVVWNSQAKEPVGTTFITDESWKTFSSDNFDRNFIQSNFNDGGWEQAYSEGPYPTTAPWAGRVVMPTKGSPNGPGLKNIKSAPGQPIIPDAPAADPAKVIT